MAEDLAAGDRFRFPGAEHFDKCIVGCFEVEADHFAFLGEIKQLEPRLKAYLKEAIVIEKSGAKVSFKTAAEFKVPEEFQKKLDKSAALKKAFTALTPGRQKAYLLFFAGAKQSATRTARVEKSIPNILKGKGLDD